MSQLSHPPPPSLSSVIRALSRSPRNGDERIVSDEDDIKHLEYFVDGSWRHDGEKCRAKINPVCNRK
jgi:hypothetical protein